MPSMPMASMSHSKLQGLPLAAMQRERLQACDEWNMAQAHLDLHTWPYPTLILPLDPCKTIPTPML